MKIFRYIFIIAIMISTSVNAQRPTPGKAQSKAMAFVGATIHIGNGTVIENGALLIENGKIVAVADARTIRLNPTTTDIIEVNGKHIYPGLIAANSQLGLAEIEAVRATLDYSETGDINPNTRAVIAYNTDSKVIPTVRSNGILTAQIAPMAGTIAGQSSIVMLDGWNWEDAAYKLEDGIWMNWPRMFIQTGWWAEPGETQKAKTEKKLDEIDAFFAESFAYYKQNNDEINLKFEAMKGLFNGTKKLYVRTDFVKEIESAVALAVKYNIKLVISGGMDAWMVAELLKKNNVQVILDYVHNLPRREDDAVDINYSMPAKLKALGIDFSINLKKPGEAAFWQQMNLPFVAGNAASYGFSKEDALSSLTLNMARVLGIDKTVGSLEDGKDATFIVSEGDILDMKSSIVTRAFIQGREVDLDNHHKELYRMYKNKYGF